MGRAERRRLEKQKGKQVKTYNLTRSQLHNAVRQVTEEDLKRIKQEAMEDAINTAMTLLLVLPMEVLMDHYWKKTYAKKIPEFTELVLQYYERWQNGELDMDEMKKVSGNGHLTPAPLSQTFEARAFPVGLGGHTGDRMESAGKGGIAAVSHHHRDLHNTEIGLYQ